jgi:hypothetical protein
MTIDLSNRRELDLAVPLNRLPFWVWILSILLFLVPVLLYRVFHNATLTDFFNLGVLLLLIPLIVGHELIHAIGWKVTSGLPWSAFSFGIDRKTLSPYCHANAPMDIGAYRIGGAAPLVVVGIIPYVFALVIGNAALALVMAIMISAAVGDIFILWTLRNVPPGSVVLDHPSKAGCIVYLPPGM